MSFLSSRAVGIVHPGASFPAGTLSVVAPPRLLSNRDIARKLNLSEHTAKNYIFRIFEKLSVSNRIELVLYALSNSRRAEASTSSDHAPKLVTAHDRES